METPTDGHVKVVLVVLLPLVVMLRLVVVHLVELDFVVILDSVKHLVVVGLTVKDLG